MPFCDADGCCASRGQVAADATAVTSWGCPEEVAWHWWLSRTHRETRPGQVSVGLISEQTWCLLGWGESCLLISPSSETHLTEHSGRAGSPCMWGIVHRRNRCLNALVYIWINYVCAAMSFIHKWTAWIWKSICCTWGNSCCFVFLPVSARTTRHKEHFKTSLEEVQGFSKNAFMVCLRLSIMSQIKSSLQMIIVLYFELI